jgi:hypothetical protein
MSNLPNATQNIQNMLNDIQSLQQLEQELFQNLENNTNLSIQQKKQIIDKINNISKMRINLYKTLGNINQYYHKSMITNQDTLVDQTSAIGVVETELNRLKNKLSTLQDEKNNKMRLVQINTYYSEKYEEQALLMKYLLFTMVPLIIVIFIYNKGFLPNFVFYGLLMLISFIGGWFIIKTWLSIVSRDNMNYQEYNWSFNPNNMSSGEKTSGEDSDPWSVNIGTCVGAECCSDNQSYDSINNICISN